MRSPVTFSKLRINMKQIQKSIMMLFLLTLTSTIWSQSSDQIIHGRFSIETATVNGYDYSETVTSEHYIRFFNMKKIIRICKWLTFGKFLFIRVMDLFS